MRYLVDGWLHAASVAIGDWAFRRRHRPALVWLLTSLLIAVLAVAGLEVLELVAGRS